jgi:hypothetical protein
MTLETSLFQAVNIPNSGSLESSYTRVDDFTSWHESNYQDAKMQKDVHRKTGTLQPSVSETLGIAFSYRQNVEQFLNGRQIPLIPGSHEPCGMALLVRQYAEQWLT